jgi:predicted PurR-regulated permease PerM
MELKWKTCFRAVVTVLVIYVLINYWNSFANIAGGVLGAVIPLIVGGIMAYAVNILMSFYENIFSKISLLVSKNKANNNTNGNTQKKSVISSLKRPFCMILAYFSIVLIVFLIIRMVVPELIGCIELLLDKMPAAIDNTVKWAEQNFDINSLVQTDIQKFLGDINIKDTIIKGVNILLSGLGGAMGIATQVVTSIISTTVTLAVAFIFSIYILYWKEKLGNQFTRLFKRYIPDKITNKIFYVLGVLNKSFKSFIIGQCTEAVILGVLCMLGMLILRLPYAVMTGCLIGFTALIPIAGAYIGAGVGALMIFTVSPVQSVIFLIYLVILQQIEGNLIYPKVVGSSIGLPGIWVLAAVTVGGGVMGIMGMLVAVPVASAIYQIVREDVNRKVPA